MTPGFFQLFSSKKTCRISSRLACSSFIRPASNLEPKNYIQAYGKSNLSGGSAPHSRRQFGVDRSNRRQSRVRAGLQNHRQENDEDTGGDHFRSIESRLEPASRQSKDS